MLALAAVCCAVPLCLLPLAGRSSLELAGDQAALDARFEAPLLQVVWSRHSVALVRDPFVGETLQHGTAPEQSTSRGVIGMHVTQGTPIGFLADKQAGETVSAVVVGASPRALVDDGGAVRVVAIGDRLGGSRVTGIDGRGVRLANGSLLELGGGEP